MQAVLTPFLLALLAAYLINPLIAMFEHRGIRRKAVVILFYLIIGSALTGTAARVLPSISQEIQELQADWPQRAASLRTVALNLGRRITNKLPGGKELLSYAEHQAQNLGSQAAPLLSNLIGNLFSLISLLFLAPLITFFFLIEGPALTQKALAACPGRHVEKVLNFLCSISESLGNYLRALIIDAAIIATMAAIGLYLLGVNYSLILGLAAGVGGMIPYLGPLLVGAIASGLAVVQFQALGPGLNVIILFAALRFADDWIIQPYIMSRAANLHPAVLLLALMTGGHFFGLLGLILAAPTACVLRVVITTLWDWYLAEAGLTQAPLACEEKLVIV